MPRRTPNRNFRNMCALCGQPTPSSSFRLCNACYAESRKEPLPGSANLPTPTYRKQPAIASSRNQRNRGAFSPTGDRTCRRCPNHIQLPYHYCTRCYRALKPDEQERERQTWSKITPQPIDNTRTPVR